MKKKALILLCLLCMACGSFKQNVTNFRAYYNTYYNAKKDFRAGLEKVEQQPVTLEPDQLIRVHPRMALTGSDDFEEAVKNSAEVLQRFPDSKWTDHALLLMGKSYYYLREYFLAIQKFEELIDFPSQSGLRQEAVIWKGRTLLDIEAYSRGVQFLQTSLTEFKDQWAPKQKAETEVVLSEHYALLKQWEKAIETLEPALQKIDAGPLKGRGYLLLGQLLQKQANYRQAFYAFSQVRENHPDYEYIYRADLERARSEQLAENTKGAADIYAAMLKDDKNFSRKNEILFHLSNNYQAEGRYREAEDLYKKILAHPNRDDPSGMRSKSYFRLGQIYSQDYHNFGLAAAYFDSSSTQRNTEDASGTENGAEKLASAYGRYVSLRQDISRVDSLLILGGLDKQTLQKRLIEIRSQRRQELRDSQNAVQQTNNTLTNTSRERERQLTVSKDKEPEKFGFLNYHNRELVRRGRQKFIAIWGRRPLVDNWRRKEMLSGKNLGATEVNTDELQAETISDEKTGDKNLGINLSDLPRTSRQKRALQQKRTHAQYRLGSLFFLTLDQPDSAAVYYKKVLHQPGGASPLEARAMYSLYELYTLHQKPDSAAAYKRRILDKYPQTRFARQLDKDDIVVDSMAQRRDSSRILRQRVQQLLTKRAGDDSVRKATGALKKLAMAHRQSPLAPSIYFQAIRMDIKAARHRDSLTEMTDSLVVQRRDSLQESAYKGSAWDSVKVDLKKFVQQFPQAAQNKKVHNWLRLLQNPDALKQIPTCKELSTQAVITGGKEKFIKSVTLPAKVRRMNISGSIRYRFVIDKDGNVKSYKLLSNSTHLGIEEAYDKAIDDHLSFQPIKEKGRPVRVSCEMTFPIHQ